jgi:hypothetical protein
LTEQGGLVADFALGPVGFGLVSLLLRFLELFERSHLLVGRQQRVAAILDMRPGLNAPFFDRFVLLGQQGFVAGGLDELVDFHRPTTHGSLSPQAANFLLQRFASPAQGLLRPLRFGQLGAPLVALGGPYAKQALESEAKGEHGIGAGVRRGVSPTC